MEDVDQEARLGLAREVAERYRPVPEVWGVALAGSQAMGTADTRSDIDLYVYVSQPVALDVRSRIAVSRAINVEIDNRFWENEDAWIDAETSIVVEVIFRDVRWIEQQLARVLDRHEASTGYTTTIWHSVRYAQPLTDRSGWLARLTEKAAQPYPDPLVHAIVGLNHPLLRGVFASYQHQLELAIARGDRVSVQHRLTALLASYFDIIFAINRELHPGEKRIVERATELCWYLPRGMTEQLDAVLDAANAPDEQLLLRLMTFLDSLDALLSEMQLMPLS